MTRGERETVPFSFRRAYTGQHLFPIFGDSTRFNGKRQLVSVLGEGHPAERVHASEANDYNPAVSHDGVKVAFVSDRDGNPELYLLNIGSTAAPTRLTETSGCVNQYPSWLPDGSGLVYESNCQGGSFEIQRAELGYAQDKRDELAVAWLISPGTPQVRRLTTNTSDDRYPRVSPDGARIAFTAARDGNPEIYTMSSDGSGQARVASHPAVDQAPSWLGYNDALAFSSDRDGDFEIFLVQANGDQLQQLTSNSVEDNWPLYGH